MSDEFRPLEKKTFDTRVIVLSKCSPDNDVQTELKKPEKNGYVCLGHFDFMRVTPLAGDDSLHSVERDYSERNNYSYPLYILHHPTERTAALAGFWETKSCFMTVSRIHFTPSARDGTNCIQESLRCLHEGSPLCGEQPGELSIRTGGDLVHCVFYHTLELSDLVVVLKSNSILACLGAIRQMMEVSVVGNVYSFCGVHGDLCRPDMEKAIGKWDQEEVCSHFQKTAREAMEQTIPYASMRFSVIVTRNARCFLERSGRPYFFVSGTADAIINFSGAPMKELIQYIAFLATGTFPVGEDSSIDLYDAFGDVITRIGILYSDRTSDLALAVGPRKHISALVTAQESLRKVLKKLPAQNRWFPILGAQIDSLITMMGNCITDDLSVLIWPSVQALVERLSFLKDHSCPIGPKQEAEIGEFLNCWDILENDISRLEGELSQKPELLSSRYYVPATLLAFYMALMHTYNEFLLAVNEEKNQSYIPLIAYNVEPRACTVCILDPSTDRITSTGKTPEVYQKATPLLVSLPVSMLYSPLEAVIVLCHEMSHYTGSGTRRREERFQRILASFADLISKIWKLDGNEDYPIVFEDCIKLKQEVEKKLREAYKKSYPDDKKHYIKELFSHLEAVILQVFYDEALQSNLMQSYLVEKTKLQSIVKYARHFSFNLHSDGLQEIKMHVRTLLLLYRECYADLAAVMALNLSAEDYLIYIFHRESKYIAETSAAETGERLWEVQIEAALVLHTLCRDFAADFSALPYSKEQLVWLEDWKHEIEYYRSKFRAEPPKDIPRHLRRNEPMGADEHTPLSTDQPSDRRGDGETAMYAAEHVNLLAYLEGCREGLEKGLQLENAKKKQKELAKMMDMVNQQFDLRAIQESIANYQDTFLKARGET